MLKTVLSVLIMVGSLGACAHLKHQAQSEGGPPALQSPVDVPAQQAPSEAPAPQPPPPQPGAVAKPAPTARAPSTPKPAQHKPAAIAAIAATAATKPATGAATAPPAANTSKPELDFKAMEQRLRDTSAIGVFTKLSIKNQADDLLNAFRGFYAGHVPPTLDELHGRFDGLVLKVVTLVQNDDATLASSISASRGAIWEKLSNKESFMSL